MASGDHSGGAGAIAAPDLSEDSTGAFTTSLSEIARRLVEPIDKCKLRSRVVGGGKSAVYAGGDVVM